MGYRDTYKAVQAQYRKYLTKKQTAALQKLARQNDWSNASARVNAADTLRKGFQSGMNGLRNTGIQASGEVERLKRRLNTSFTDTMTALKTGETAALSDEAQKLYKKTRSARLRAARKAAAEKQKELLGRQKQKSSGQRGTGGGKWREETR